MSENLEVNEEILFDEEKLIETLENGDIKSFRDSNT